MGFEGFLGVFFDFWGFLVRMTNTPPPEPAEGARGAQSGHEGEPRPVSAGQSELARPTRVTASRGKPNPFGHFRHQRPDDFRLRPKPVPSLFGNFRKPGREAAKRVRASPERQ